MNIMHKRIWLPLALTMILLVLVPGAAEAEPPVKNVILMIGDGMGFNQILAARLSLEAGAAATLNMDTMPYTGFSINYALNNLVTDSAAAATALATGYRTDTGRVATLPDGTPLQSIMRKAQEEGRSIGVVATVSVTDATPAAFLANADSRSFERTIAADMLKAQPDVLLGGGADAFGINPFTKQPRSGSLVNEAMEAGYSYVADRESLLELEIRPDSKLLGLFMGGDMSFELTRFSIEPTITEMTQRALDVVGQNPQGFFLMVEGSRIDRAGHSHSIAELIADLLIFDQAVGLALNYAKQHAGTLVVVTADHETGGLGVTSGDPAGESVNYGWLSTGHTAAMVPIYAYGPGAERFTGTLQITDIPVRMAELLGMTNFPAILEVELDDVAL